MLKNFYEIPDNLRVLIDKGLRPLVLFMVRKKVSPNFITVLPIPFLILLTHLTVGEYQKYPEAGHFNVWVLGIFGLSLLDNLDGALARAIGPTKFGAFLDSFVDRVFDFIFVAGIGYFVLQDSPVGLALMLLTIFAQTLPAFMRAKIENSLGHCPAGIGDRLNRGVVYLIFSVFQLFHVALCLVSLMSLSTVIYRLLYFRKAVRSLNP